jgi:hypothetical protein
MYKEAPQEDERTLITEKDPPPESSIPMIENQNTENINATAMMTQTKDQKAPINKQEFVKNERPSQKMNSSSSSMLDVVPAPQKQEKKAEKYHEKINSLKYQLEQAHQQYYNDHQAHLRFVKEWESKDHHTLYQISLVEQRLRHVLRQRSMPSTCPQNEPSRLRTTRSYHDLMKDEAANEGECQSDYRLEKDDHGFYDAQRKDMMTHDRIYDEDAQRRWMEDYYRYCDYYYRQQPYKYHYYNENTNDYYWDDDYFRSTYEPRIPYYGSKERGIEADERGENTYYQYREWR